MSDLRIGSSPSPQSLFADTLAPREDSPSQQTVVDGFAYIANTDQGLGYAIQSHLPLLDDAPQTLDIARIIAEARDERSEDARERALNAAARIQDMVAQHAAAMERFREARANAEAEANAAAAAEAEAAAAEADVAMAQPATLDATTPASASIQEPSPAEYAASLVAQLTSPEFVPANAAATELAATALAQLALSYDDTTASQLLQPLLYWSHVAREQLEAGTRSGASPAVPATAADSSAIAVTPTPPAPVAVQGNPFWGIGDTGATGQETVAGEAVTGAQYVQDKALVFVTRTVNDEQLVERGDSSVVIYVPVQRQFAVTIGEAARELNLDAAGAAAYLAQHGAYLLDALTIGNGADFAARHGRAATAADLAYVVREQTTTSGESGDIISPAIYGTAPEQLRAVGHKLGVYEWLPADVIDAARADTGGHVVLAASDQVTTVQAHLDEQAVVFVSQTGLEYVHDGRGEGSYVPAEVTREVAVPTFQAAAQLGLTGAAIASYAEAHRAYCLPDGQVVTRAAFEAAAGRAPTANDRAFIVRAPLDQANGDSGNVTFPAQMGNEAAYLEAIGLSPATPRELTIAFNDSRSRSGDVRLDTSRRTIDLTQPNTPLSRAYHAVANDALASEWVQIGDLGPINDDVAKLLPEVYRQFGADTPEKQETVRRQLFRYDASYGVIANRALVEGAVEMNNNRRNGFFESGFGRALVMVAANVVGGPALAAGASAAFTAYDGGSLGDIAKAGAAAYAGGAVGAGVGGAVTTALGSSVTAVAVGGAAQGVASSATSQLIATGRIDGDALLAAGLAGGVAGGVTSAVAGTDFAARADQTLGVAPGTTARIIGGQAASLVTGGGLSWESALTALGQGVAGGDDAGGPVMRGPDAADSPLEAYEALGYPAAQAEQLRAMGFPPEKLLPYSPGDATDALSDVARLLQRHPDLTVELGPSADGGQTLRVWTRDGVQVTYAFADGALTSSQANFDRAASGVGAQMEEVSALADQYRADPNNEVEEINDYKNGVQQIIVRTAGKPPVQYNYENGTLVSMTPAQQQSMNVLVDHAVNEMKYPRSVVEPWGAAALAGRSLVARGIPANVAAMGRFATVALHTREPGESGNDVGSGVLAVANIGGVDRAVLITAAHVVEPGELTAFSARSSTGALVEIPFDNQYALTTGVAAGDRVSMNASDEAKTDGFLVTLSPETLNALRPGATLASLPRVGGPPSAGTPTYQFGFAQWGNVGRDGQVRGFNLVGTVGTSGGAANGGIAIATAVNATNPPVTTGMSGGPLFEQLADGTVRVTGISSSVIPYRPRYGGTQYTSHLAVHTNLDWLLSLAQ